MKERKEFKLQMWELSTDKRMLKFSVVKERTSSQKLKSDESQNLEIISKPEVRKNINSVKGRGKKKQCDIKIQNLKVSQKT